MSKPGWTTVVLAAALSSLATACVLTFTKCNPNFYDDYPTQKPAESAPKSTGTSSKPFLAPSQEEQEELILEQLARSRVFFGDDGLEVIRKSSVVIVGAGGVGSWAATMLLRSGVGNVRLIDFDQVTLSSLNRHATANRAHVGIPKVESVKQYFSGVVPWANIEAVQDLWVPVKLSKSEEEYTEMAERLIYVNGEKPDWVLDCIDNIDAKVDLLHFCKSRDIKVISSMGAGCKSDFTQVRIADISQTAEDPLSKATRVKLRKLGVYEGIPVIFSTEKPGEAKLLPLADSEFEKKNEENETTVGELSVLPQYRVRILPVLGSLPAIFGLSMATHVLTSIGDYASIPEYIITQSRHKPKAYDQIQQTLVGQLARESKRRTGENGIRIAAPFDSADVGYLVEEVYKNKSVISGECSRLSLSRWRKDGPINLQNVVVMTKDEQKKHEELVLCDENPKTVEEVYPEWVLNQVEHRLRQEKHYSMYR